MKFWKWIIKKLQYEEPIPEPTPKPILSRQDLRGYLYKAMQSFDHIICLNEAEYIKLSNKIIARCMIIRPASGEKVFLATNDEGLMLFIQERGIV